MTPSTKATTVLHLLPCQVDANRPTEKSLVKNLRRLIWVSHTSVKDGRFDPDALLFYAVKPIQVDCDLSSIEEKVQELERSWAVIQERALKQPSPAQREKTLDKQLHSLIEQLAAKQRGLLARFHSNEMELERLNNLSRRYESLNVEGNTARNRFKRTNSDRGFGSDHEVDAHSYLPYSSATRNETQTRLMYLSPWCNPNLARKSPLVSVERSMGESETEYFSNDDRMIVMWNMDDYPIPPGVDIRSIRPTIVAALRKMGFSGRDQIWAYGGRVPYGLGELAKEAITYVPESEFYVADFIMPVDMIYGLRASTNAFVMAKQRPESELYRVQQCLKSRDHIILVLVDDDTAAQESPFQSEQSLVDRTRVFGGGKPLNINSSGVDEAVFEEFFKNESSSDGGNSIDSWEDASTDISKIIDFSEPIPPVQENDRTVVFWDVGDCPFPVGSPPDEIYSRIYEALRKRNCGGDVKIWAYIDEKSGEHLRNKTWPSRLYFLPGGASRRNRMLNDILILVIGSDEAEESYQSNVVVVSDQFRGDFFNNRLEGLSDGYRYFVYLVTPTESVNKPDVLEWPGLLLDHVVSFPRPQIPAAAEVTPPPLKKHKPDAAQETAERGRADMCTS
ncbi:unnamed protein product [Thlaspi arvense]|uniref:NYN domain-containing protein n=1 Tax=Thlaspi arvense TaxID=13288 RepID=A0AAU9SXS2_THLAR|nr:unnamed protein product [Thlaspi arvense]